MTTPAFIPGLELSRRFYTEAVRPVLEQAVPGPAHSAARIGTGSEVLGFDTARSADHEWGPRLQIFVSPQDAARHGPRISDLLSHRLPKTFCGYPTHFTSTGEAGIGTMQVTDGPVHHRVEITDPGTWFTTYLGFDPRQDITLDHWLATPTQRLAEVTRGAVFHDGLGQLAPMRAPPYSKWLGSAFALTPQGPHLTPILYAVLAAPDWRVREQHLAHAYETIAALHNDLALTDPVDPATRPYHSRPFRVLHAERFTAALTARIADPEIRTLPTHGAVDQFIDSTEVLSQPGLTRAVISKALLSGRS